MPRQSALALDARLSRGAAVVSVRFRHADSDVALAHIRKTAVHIRSILAWAEVRAVTARHLRTDPARSAVTRSRRRAPPEDRPVACARARLGPTPAPAVS